MPTKKIKVTVVYPIVSFSSAEYETEVDEDFNHDWLCEEEKADFILEQYEKGNLAEQPTSKKDIMNCLDVDYCRLKITEVAQLQ